MTYGEIISSLGPTDFELWAKNDILDIFEKRAKKAVFTITQKPLVLGSQSLHNRS